MKGTSDEEETREALDRDMVLASEKEQQPRYRVVRLGRYNQSIYYQSSYLSNSNYLFYRMNNIL